MNDSDTLAVAVMATLLLGADRVQWRELATMSAEEAVDQAWAVRRAVFKKFAAVQETRAKPSPVEG